MFELEFANIMYSIQVDKMLHKETASNTKTYAMNLHDLGKLRKKL